jgi:hypothetical protein
MFATKPRNCPMCGAAVTNAMCNCPTCGENLAPKQRIESLRNKQPRRAFTMALELAILIGTIVLICSDTSNFYFGVAILFSLFAIRLLIVCGNCSRRSGKAEDGTRGP